MKSKMPCRPGPVPVANVVHATGDCGGLVEASGRSSPRSASARRWGSFPSSSQRERRRGSTPSKPRITSRGPRRPTSCPPPQPPPIAASSAIATQRTRSALLLQELPLELRGIGGDAEPARRDLGAEGGRSEQRSGSAARAALPRIVRRSHHDYHGSLLGPLYHSRTMLSPWSPAIALRVSTTRRAVRATAR